LRDGLKAISASSEVQSLAESVPDSGGVMFVPAFTGLGAPYWQAEARGAIVGLTRGSTVAHIARAALESIAYQSAALLQAMSRDAADSSGGSVGGTAAGGTSGAATQVTELRVDGGACVNDLLMQFQADLLGIPVVRPKVIETTALGAAYLAGLATGVYKNLDELSSQWQVERRFHPTLARDRAQELMARWEHAVRQTVAN
jgi:glycerol kinase